MAGKNGIPAGPDKKSIGAQLNPICKEPVVFINFVEMKKIAGLVVCVILSLPDCFAQKDYTKYVDPIIGTYNEFQLSNGNVLPFAARPWGMNFWTPQTALNGDPWQYIYTAKHITGFKQSHQPSPWGGDYSMFSVMPTIGKKKFLENDRKSWFSHKEEIAKPHYYSVYLADYFIRAEMVPTSRACIMRFTYPESDQSNIVVDAFDNDSFIQVIPEENKIIGYTTETYHYNNRAPKNFKNYFVILFNKPFKEHSIWMNDGFVSGITEAKGGRTGVVITFDTTDGEQVEAYIASSFISFEQAEINMNEINGKSFDQVCEEGKNEWNELLSRFAVADENIDDLDNIRMFYSALYRMLLYPREFFEYDKEGNIIHYSPFNGEVLPGRMYTDNGYWDTFRAERPFFDLFFPEWSSCYMESVANIYKESGWLPEWVSPGHINAMIGSNSSSVIASAYLNKVKGLDMDLFWDAVNKMAYNAHPTMTSVGRAGAVEYDKLGYVPSDVGISESVARTLEYAYADYCIMRIAEEMGKDQEVIDKYASRARNYKNVFNKDFNLMSRRNSEGVFDPEFNPLAWGRGFTEGNSWHYTWSVFHDPEGLADLMGGNDVFTAMLDSVFIIPPTFDCSEYGQVIHEIREMNIVDFGQYAHGNQPIQHMIYLYDWTSQPWKTQYWSRQVMSRLYRPTPDGYCGDEDNGQTSAWYVFSALGMYPVNPVSGEYALGSPLFRNITITLPNGKKLEISAPNNSENNVYVNEMKINGKRNKKNYITREQILKGGRFKFEMSDSPNMARGTDEMARPYSMSKDDNL